MTFEGTLLVLDLAGTFVFAVSGALAAARKRMDIVGMFALALVTATGGGTLRSFMIGDLPVPLLRTPWPFALILTATVLTFFFHRRIERMQRPIRLFDAIGLGVFVAAGVAISLDLGQPWWAALLLGCITATFGGILRDVLRNEVPFIFNPGELYATPAFAGAVVLLGLELGVGGVSRPAAMIAGAGTTIALRLFSIYFRWRTRPAVGGG
jgi:uncharacterized membrane protein YeiH